MGYVYLELSLRLLQLSRTVASKRIMGDVTFYSITCEDVTSGSLPFTVSCLGHISILMACVSIR